MTNKVDWDYFRRQLPPRLSTYKSLAARAVSQLRQAFDNESVGKACSNPYARLSYAPYGRNHREGARKLAASARDELARCREAGLI